MLLLFLIEQVHVQHFYRVKRLEIDLFGEVDMGEAARIQEREQAIIAQLLYGERVCRILPVPCRLLCKDQWGTSEERCVGGICRLDVLLTGIDFEDSQRDRTALKL